MGTAFPTNQLLTTTTGEVSTVTLGLYMQGAQNWGAWQTSNTGDHSALLDDGVFAATTPCLGSTYAGVYLRGVSNGTYRVYTYAAWPDPSSDASVAVNTAPEAHISGTMPGDAFIEGVTHTVHEVAVTNGNIFITVFAGAGSYWETFLGGVQIVPVQLDGCSIAQQPADQTVLKEHTATFTAALTGDVRAYQWTKDGIALANGRGISGATTQTLTLAEARPSDDGVYALRYLCGGAYQSTAGATLTVVHCPGDVDGDGDVELTDLSVLLAHFGSICP
ncbi:MAG: hypothetical protein ACKVS9_12875 [Phycisphaerae bacterium]